MTLTLGINFTDNDSEYTIFTPNNFNRKWLISYFTLPQEMTWVLSFSLFKF